MRYSRDGRQAWGRRAQFNTTYAPYQRKKSRRKKLAKTQIKTLHRTGLYCQQYDYEYFCTLMLSLSDDEKSNVVTFHDGWPLLFCLEYFYGILQESWTPLHHRGPKQECDDTNVICHMARSSDLRLKEMGLAIVYPVRLISNSVGRRRRGHTWACACILHGLCGPCIWKNPPPVTKAQTDLGYPT